VCLTLLLWLRQLRQQHPLSLLAEFPPEIQINM
jgi:hypothetical protein